jgi:outer membrane protein OmpU
MKKILLASTIAAGFAGAAAAEVTLSGSASFGMNYNGTTSTLLKRMTVQFDGGGESDSGMGYGAMLRLRSNEAAGTVMSGARVFLKAGGLEIGAGNINGAIESMPNLYTASVGLADRGLGYHGVVTNAGSAYWNWDSFSSSGNGAEGIEVMYSAGSLGTHLSFSEANGFSNTAGTSGRRSAAYVSYAFGDWTVAIGGQTSSVVSANKTVVTIGGKVGNFDLALAGADNNGTKKYALSGSTTFGATTVNAFVAREDLLTTTLWGVGVAHDLGGVTLSGGVGSDRAGKTNLQAGVGFSF